MRSKIRANRFALVSLALLIALLPAVANGQAIIKVNDNVNFRLGIVLQAWADWNGQSNATGETDGFQQNLFLRRARFLVGGQVAKDVTFFFMTDNANLGKSTQTTAPGATGGKAPATGFVVQDAFVEWAIANEFRLQGGLILIPLCRNCNSSAHLLASMDYGTWSFQESASTQSSTGRDTGFQARGYLAGDHLEYRAGAYSGFRAPGVKNSFRFAGRLQYNVFDVEKGQFYPGVYFGKKKILAIGAGYDSQSDYSAWAGDIFFDYPVGKNGITAQVDYVHYDGGVTFNTAALFKQDDLFVEAGFFLSGPKIMPFARYEILDYEGVNNVLNRTKYQGGIGYYPYGSNFNIKAGFTRTEAPNNPNVASTNQYTVQIQVFYY
ncbi:MAG: hypothetical protein NEA02_10985 [Thermoanaerobaculia bacterium]|nr:hypothetical protein [Thermoanaerobaculia bacterium]